ncbi:hypothetical protein HS141_06270 [Cetobacterium somerae]|uniref:hypothetical protein n=1 Tax=Cetobacterium somerae TaxID=188913 RepID=UPI00211F3046|nr:hypothetical protein [Cetobacterium somerae]MCQ9626577.1 hypothetical protein [Cetobacterium somerae]
MMKLYSFLYENGSYQKIYQSFNKKSLEFTRNKLKNNEEGPKRVSEIFIMEIDIENEVWTA